MSAPRATPPAFLETYETPEDAGDLPDLESYETASDDAASFADEFSEYDHG